MQKLLLFIAIMSFYSIVAMDQVALIEDPNAQDQQGNTPFCNAATAWQKSISSMHKKAKEYADLNKQYKQLQREIAVEHESENVRYPLHTAISRRTNNNQLAVLDARRQTLLEMAKIVKAEHVFYKEQADLYKDRAIQLIKSGAYINAPNLNRHLMWDIVYYHIWLAIEDGDVVTVEKYLRIGANPDFIEEEAGHTTLHWSINCNKPEAARKLLFGGAKSTSNLSFEPGAATVLHYAANRGTYTMVETLLCSPQGSPSVYSSTYNDKKTLQEIFTFLCCMHRNKDTITELPSEVCHNICKFMLPAPAALIELVPLQQISKYIKFLGRTTLIKALTKRHMELMGTALTINSDINRGDVLALPPHQYTRLSEFDDIDLLKDEKAVRRALDPAHLEEHRAAIEANYTKLLE